MSSKKYVLVVVSLLYVFIILNVAMWQGMIGKMFALGSLNRMGSFMSTESLTPEIEYSEHHTEISDYIASGKKRTFDVVTIGDSYSNGNGGSYYQDYLKEKYGVDSLNARFTNHCLEDLYILIQSGILDEVKPKAVILDSVENAIQLRLGNRRIEDGLVTREAAIELVKNSMKTKTVESVASGFFPNIAVNANMKFVKDKIFHFFHPEQLSTEVYITELNRDVFTNPGYEHTLLFYFGDLVYLKSPTDTEMVNRNLNHAARILREKNIALIFFAGVDKYDLYYPYMINHNGRPENNFFPDMRKISDKDYVFIDTLKIMREATEKNERDLYWLGDDHWSWKGMHVFCDELVKHLDWLN